MSQEFPKTLEELQEEDLLFAQEFIVSDEFKSKFSAMCQMDSIPEVNLGQMKLIKTNFIDKVITPTFADELGNAARLLSSWLDGILEFTILKHEVIVLKLKNNKVAERIREISNKWPQKKQFIEGAYKILFYTKNQRRQVNWTLKQIKEASKGEGSQIDYDFMNYGEAQQRVVKKWYEDKIVEETQKNQRLRDLHESLTRLKELKELEQKEAAEAKRREDLKKQGLYEEDKDQE